MSAKIFAELVEQIIVFKDKTVTLVLKIDKDLNSYFDKKSIDLSNFTLILPPKSLKFEESKRKIKISPNEENSGRDSIETSNNHRMYRLTKWPTEHDESEPLLGRKHSWQDKSEPIESKNDNNQQRTKLLKQDNYNRRYLFSFVNENSTYFKKTFINLYSIKAYKKYLKKHLYKVTTNTFIIRFNKNNELIVPLERYYKNNETKAIY